LIRLDKWLLAVSISVVIICAQIITTQYSIIAHLRQKVEMAEMSHNIEMAQINDLQYQLETIRDNNAAAEARGFVAGAVDAIQRRDYYSEVWHSGYSRGTEVQQYANQLDREQKSTAYTTQPAAD